MRPTIPRTQPLQHLQLLSYRSHSALQLKHHYACPLLSIRMITIHRFAFTLGMTPSSDVRHFHIIELFTWSDKFKIIFVEWKNNEAQNYWEVSVENALRTSCQQFLITPRGWSSLNHTRKLEPNYCDRGVCRRRQPLILDEQRPRYTNHDFIAFKFCTFNSYWRGTLSNLLVQTNRKPIHIKILLECHNPPSSVELFFGLASRRRILWTVYFYESLSHNQPILSLLRGHRPTHMRRTIRYSSTTHCGLTDFTHALEFLV